MKILIYDTNFVKGVSRMPVLLKVPYWQKKGCKITILCTPEGEDFYKSKLNNIDFISVDYSYKINGPFSLPWEYTKITLRAIPHLFSIREKFDVIYSETAVIDFLFFPWILKFFDKKIKWFVMVDNLVPPPHKRPGLFIRNSLPYIAFLIGNLLLKRADGIFVVTDFLKNYYTKKGMRVIKTNDGYGIEKEIFKGKISPSTPKFDALYCGRLHMAKGVFDLVEVLKNVVVADRHFTLGILGVGEVKIKNLLEKKIQEYNLSKNISLLGYKTGKEKGDILRSSKLFLFLSYDEGCPHAVIEAFAVNKVVVAYDLPIYHIVFKKYINSGQMILFKQKQYDTISIFITEGKYKKIKFNNNLSDYTWDRITRNELLIMNGKP